MYKHKFIIAAAIFFVSVIQCAAQQMPGFGGFQAAILRAKQDIKFKDINPGTFYSLSVNYGGVPLGFEIGPAMVGLYTKCGFGIGYSFENKGDISDKIQLDLMLGLGPAAYMPVGNMGAVGLKFYFLYDLDRISSRGFVAQPSVIVGPVLLEAGFLSPMSGEDKDLDHKMTTFSLMLINGRVGYGIKYDKRTALLAAHSPTRASYEQIQLVLEVR